MLVSCNHLGIMRSCLIPCYYEMYSHFIYRLTPAYLFMIIMYTNLLYFAVDGPYWPTQDKPPYRTLDPNCKSNWYLNILYVNNMFDFNNQVSVQVHFVKGFSLDVKLLSPFAVCKNQERRPH